MERCVVLGARSYDFQDRDTGRAVSGVNITYLVEQGEQSPERRGFEPLTIPTSQEVFALLDMVPGLYEMDVKQRPGPRGRPQLTCVALRFLRPVDLSGLLVASG